MTTILLLRLASALLATYTLYLVYTDVNGLEMRYEDKRIVIRGLSRWTTFTVWCFTMLTLHFWLATAATVTPGVEWLESLATATFAIAHPLSVLVTAVVSFVLYPKAEKHGFYVDRMFKFRPQMMHNANVVMMQAEMLLGPWPLEPHHGLLVLAFCTSYGVFAWWWFRRTGIYYYFFLDYRRKSAVATYAGVLVLVGALFALSLTLAQKAAADGLDPVLAAIVGAATLAILRVRRKKR